VLFQRASEGYPLDDVVIRAHDQVGAQATLEIQVKRSISFTASDEVFRSVVSQVVEAARKPDVWGSKHELAVATARTSRKIDGPYQDVLTWARQIGSAATFIGRIDQKGVASDDMRNFVATFRGHLKDSGFAHDDETVWKLLRRFQILVFDYTAVGSASEALARERSARALEPSDAARGGDLWRDLMGLALSIASKGGDRSREALRNDENLKGYRWATLQLHYKSLAVLAADGAAALADIRDQINGASISRAARVAEVQDRLDIARYIEIRGDAGVGKSGILKHFALQAATSTGIVVLKHERVTPRGWAALRNVLSFDGAAARDLLVELAADGTGLLFIDNLDLFTSDERVTVNDLVRAAATVPGFSVIATARRKSGPNDDVWLAQEALDDLGRAPPIIIGELDDAEVEEMAAAAPALAGLLSSNHPARDVTRNLFRLARLAARPTDAPVLRTEIDMADEWWGTADGPEEGRRERARTLRNLAEQAIRGIATFDVSSHPAASLDSLTRSETLRDYGHDRAGFRHDVLREWAVAKYLGIEEAAFDQLVLTSPAQPFLARGVELYSRSLIEGAADHSAWSALLSEVSGPGIHASWRRAVLLALVRSEAAAEVLKTAEPVLTAADSALLNELVRTTMAVDAQPARELFAEAGLDVSLMPDSLTVPSGPSWLRLIAWLLKLDDKIPGGSIPAVVDLFTSWSVGMLGFDNITPHLLRRLYRWLTTIEAAWKRGYYRERSKLFGGVLSADQIGSLREDIRRGFAMFANRVPDLAVAYLAAAKDREDREQIASAIHKFRGALAAAAPDELADLFGAALIQEPKKDERDDDFGGGYRDRAFTLLDSSFLPVSPAQGPFVDLLKARPETGKRLVRKLVDHAIKAETHGYNGSPETIEIQMPEGVRRFLWPHTIIWSREAGSRYHAVTSGLMALEGWGHERIDAGEAVDAVIADIIGTGDTPAAYLMIAIDLVLSHWPASKTAAVSFVANPQLLVMDRTRQAREHVEFPDIFGLKAIQREPTGPITAASLAARPSRDASLEVLLKFYTFDEEADHRERAVALLEAARATLDEPTPESNLGDPEFMVLHALNQLDPANWQPREVELEDGSKAEVREYVSPKSEADHLAPFQAQAEESLLSVHVHKAAATLLDNPGRGNPEAVKVLVEWARAQLFPNIAQPDEEGRDVAAWSLGETITNIALIAMREGDTELRRSNRDWAHDVFARRLSQPMDRASGMLDRLQFNPLAIAFVGYAFSLRDRAEEADVRQLLEIVSNESSAASRGLAASAVAIAKADERILKSVVRCALKATVYCDRNWDDDESVYEARKKDMRREVAAAVASELDWLFGRSGEPAWPDLPLRNPLARRGILLGGDPVRPRRRRMRPETFVDSAAAGRWLDGLKNVADVSQRPWLRSLIEHYRPWTHDANGGSLEEDEDLDQIPTEWNDAYFNLLAACASGLSIEEVDQFALNDIAGLPFNARLSVIGRLVRSVDVIYLDTQLIEAGVAAHIRQKLAQAVRQNYSWSRFAEDRSASVETRIGDAISAFFFHVYHGGFAPPHCYLVSDVADKAHALLPVLETLAAEAPTILIATELMTVLEVRPHPAQLSFAIAVTQGWITQRQDFEFWVDYGIGKRLCKWLQQLLDAYPALFASNAAGRDAIDQILAALVRVGVPEARQLETKLTGL